jgi:hypothetical protein
MRENIVSILPTLKNIAFILLHVRCAAPVLSVGVSGVFTFWGIILLKIGETKTLLH